MVFIASKHAAFAHRVNAVACSSTYFLPRIEHGAELIRYQFCNQAGECFYESFPVFDHKIKSFLRAPYFS